MLEQKLYVLPDQKLVYLSNAKAGCSTLKASLWQAVSPDTFNPDIPAHDRRGSPFSPTIKAIAKDLDGFAQSTFFTVVRNPYSRVLSAYLDKIMRKKRDQGAWRPISDRFALAPGSHPPLVDLLEAMADEDPSLLDQHFAPQYINTLHHYVECDFVGHLEKMDEVATFLQGYGAQIHAYRTHSTSASNKVIEALSPREIELIRKIHAKDFELFGYSEDPTRLAPVAPMQRTPVGKDRLLLLLRGITGRNRAESDAAFDALGALMPEHEIVFNQLEFGGRSRAELTRIVKEIDCGAIRNWRVVAKAAELLLRRNSVSQALHLLEIAERIMRKGNTPDLGRPAAQTLSAG